MISKEKFKTIMITICIIIVFKFLLQLLYVYIVSPNFSYMGFTLDSSMSKIFEGYMLSILIGIILVGLFSNKQLPSNIVLYILFINLLLPMLSLYGLQDRPRVFIYSTILGYGILMITLLLVPKLKLKILEIGKFGLVILIILITLYVYLHLLLSGGLQRINFNLLDVYDIRTAYVNNSSGIIRYFIMWQAYVINVILIWYGLYNKKKSILFIGLTLQVILFAMTGFKSFIFAPLMIIGVYYLITRNLYSKFLPYMIIGSIVIMFFSFCYYLLTKDITLTSIFVRRLLFIPALHHFYYFEFFAINPKLLLGHSILAPFVEYSYNQIPIHVISMEYYGREAGLNVGMFGDAYANFGIVGIFLFSFSLALVLKLLDSISVNLPLSLSVLLMLNPGMALVNSAMLTVFLTHGFLFALLSLWLLSIKFKNNVPKFG